MIFPTVGGESTNPENMEALHKYVHSWSTEEYDNIYLPSWNGVDQYCDSVEPHHYQPTSWLCF